MTKRAYYGWWVNLVFPKAWNISRQVMAIGTFISISFAAILIIPYIKSHLPDWGVTVADIVWWISLTAVVILGILVVSRFFLAPYWIHEEQEKKIKDLNKKMETRTALLDRCREFSERIDKGEDIRKRCRKENIPGKEIKEWLSNFEAYLKTLDSFESLGSLYIEEWKNEGEIEPLEEQAQRGNSREERILYQIFVFRLTRSWSMRSRWVALLEQYSLVPRGTTSPVTLH